MKLQIPLVMRVAEMAYCCVAVSAKLTVKRKITYGGVINPPTMANACCNPMRAARRSGSGSSADEKGRIGRESRCEIAFCNERRRFHRTSSVKLNSPLP